MMLWSGVKDAYLQRLGLHGGGRHLEKGTQILGRFTRYVDPFAIQDVDQEAYEAYLARRKKDASRKRSGQPISAATLNGEIRYLNTLFGWVGERRERFGLEPDWHPPRMRLLREPKRRPRTLHEEQMERLFDSFRFAKTPTISGCRPCDWWHGLYRVAYVTGIRREALLTLDRPTEAELDRQELYVPAELDKADEDRVFHLPDHTVAAIRKLNREPGQRMFAWPFTSRYFYTVLHRFQAAAGIPPSERGLLHDMRRTKGTNMIKDKCPLPLVQRELGHSSPAVTAKCYVGSLTDEQREAVERLPVPKPADRQLLLFAGADV